MNYIISKNQISDVLARIAKQPVDKSLFSKVRDFLKGDQEVIGRVILQSIKNGKVKINNYEEDKDFPTFIQKFDLEIGNLPIEFKRIKRFRGVLDYYLDIPFFDIKKLKVSDSISEKIYQSIFAQLKKESYAQLFESENHLADILSKVAKQPVDSSLLSKVKNFFGGDDEVVARVVLQSIKNGKAKITNFDEYTPLNKLHQKIDFQINNLPLEITRDEQIFKRYGDYSYKLKIPFFGDKELEVSDLLLKNIFNSIFGQYKKEGIGELFESEQEQDSSALAKQIKRVLKDKGVQYAVDFFGGMENLLNWAYDGDLEKFAKDNDIKLVDFSSDGLMLSIHEFLVKKMKLKARNFGGIIQLELGKFAYGPKSSQSYRVNAYLTKIPKRYPWGDYYRVIAIGGDYGFGFYGITQRNTLGKKYRQQIYNQIIDKYKLGKYV